LGNVTTLSLLSDPDAIPKPLYEIVEPYLMSIVLYGCHSCHLSRYLRI
jgi:hypothetical protein